MKHFNTIEEMLNEYNVFIADDSVIEDCTSLTKAEMETLSEDDTYTYKYGYTYIDSVFEPLVLIVATNKKVGNMTARLVWTAE